MNSISRAEGEKIKQLKMEQGHGSRASLGLMMLGLMFVVQVNPSLAIIPRQRLRSLSVIRKMNQKGPYIGLVTVYPPEENAFFATGSFQPHPQHPFVDLSG